MKGFVGVKHQILYTIGKNEDILKMRVKEIMSWFPQFSHDWELERGRLLWGRLGGQQALENELLRKLNQRREQNQNVCLRLSKSHLMFAYLFIFTKDG